MRYLLPVAALALVACAGTSSVTIVHFTDYHSHAVPFFVRGEHEAAGIARAFAYIEPLAERDDVIVLNGGDTMNRGAPPWSDKYGCVEWSWWNGVVDAMAYGNHDADYGPESFEKCQAAIEYPILGGNVLDGNGERMFLHEGKPYLVLERSGKRIGLFALAGSDFPSLLRQATSPVEGVAFSDRIAAAREIVRALRTDEGADVVVLFGHAHNEEDEALAREVPGIDLILGTHSHMATPLRRIEGTDTWMISGGQYLEVVARVEIAFHGRVVAGIEGELVPMVESVAESTRIAREVSRLQTELVADPRYSALFEPFGELDDDLSNEDVNETQTDLGRFVMGSVRQAAGADMAFSTSSSFRGGLPAGPVSDASLLEVLPYDNAVVVYEMTGEEMAMLLERARSLRGTDAFIQLSGIRVDEDAGMRASWKVATTDYVARVSPRWKGLFEGKIPMTTDLRVRSTVRDAIER